MKVPETFSFVYNALPDRDLKKWDPFIAEEKNTDQKDN